MNQDEIENNQTRLTGQKNTGTPGTESINSDNLIESKRSQDVANNIETEINSDQKENLLAELQESNVAMKSEIDKLTKIAATSQSQYIMLKNEFDSYIRRIDSEKKEIKLTELKKIVAKFSKLLEQLRLFFHSLEAGNSGQEFTGLQLIYESFIGQELASMGVFQIQSLGLKPDVELHEVLIVQPATQENLDYLKEHTIKLDWEREEYSLEDLSGYIISELEVGYYYFDGEKKIVIKPSKVIVAE